MTGPLASGQRVAIVGGGWAGLAAAVRATEKGFRVTLYEAAREWGGRARTLPPHGGLPRLDNGQHILIGAYTATLDLMQRLGVDVKAVLQPVPLSLRFASGEGLAIPTWASRLPKPLDVLAGMVLARGWAWSDKWALLNATRQWQRQRFTCSSEWTVSTLCHGLPPKVRQELIEPLCLSALNTPLDLASAAVFLRVLQDALLGPGWGNWRAADLLLPRTDLSGLLPRPAVRWLQEHGAEVRMGERVHQIEASDGRWRLDGRPYDAVVLACPPWAVQRLLHGMHCPSKAIQETARRWAEPLQDWRHEAIATVYLQGAALPAGQPVLALHSTAQAPAQFVFDRGQLTLEPGLLACVVSACRWNKAELEPLVLAQAREQLQQPSLQIVNTVIEKRATFACTPGLRRPQTSIAPGLWAVGDWTEGPYPATLEGAVRNGLAAIERLSEAAALA